MPCFICASQQFKLSFRAGPLSHKWMPFHLHILPNDPWCAGAQPLQWNLLFCYLARLQCHLAPHDLQKFILCYQNWRLLQYVDVWRAVGDIHIPFFSVVFQTMFFWGETEKSHHSPKSSLKPLKHVFPRDGELTRIELDLARSIFLSQSE